MLWIQYITTVLAANHWLIWGVYKQIVANQRYSPKFHFTLNSSIPYYYYYSFYIFFFIFHCLGIPSPTSFGPLSKFLWQFRDLDPREEVDNHTHDVHTWVIQLKLRRRYHMFFTNRIINLYFCIYYFLLETDYSVSNMYISTSSSS